MSESTDNLTWTVPEYKERSHSNDWYWGIGLATLVAVVLSIYYGNYLLGVLLALGIGSLLYFTSRTPRELSITLGHRDIKINETTFPYIKIKSFWIEEPDTILEGNDRHLLIMTDKHVMPLVAIPLGSVDPAIIREKLIAVVKEEEMAEVKTHQFLEVFGF